MVIGRNIVILSKVYVTLILSLFFFFDPFRSCDAALCACANSIHEFITIGRLSQHVQASKTRTGIKINFKLMANYLHNYMKGFILGNIIQVSSS